MPSANTFIDWDKHVYSKAFDQACDLQSKSYSSSSSGSDFYEDISIWDSDDASSLTSADSSHHAVGKLEAYLYYNGIRGSRKAGPKLIYRTSKDIFSTPEGPTQDLRMMQLLTVHNHAKLSHHLWATVRDETAIILDRKKIKYTSVDLVRFRWQEETDSGRQTITSAVTIWVGVLPDSTNADVAFDATRVYLETLFSQVVEVSMQLSKKS